MTLLLFTDGIVIPYFLCDPNNNNNGYCIQWLIQLIIDGIIYWLLLLLLSHLTA
jgi:hypothetical protein